MIPRDDDDDDGCSQTKRLKTKNSNEPWNQDADVQALSKRNKSNAKQELGEAETFQRKALGASIHEDICRVQERMADRNKTAGSQRNEWMMSIRKDIHLVRQKLANLEKMVPPGGKVEADAYAEYQAFQQVLGMMTIVNICERPIHPPFEKIIVNEKKKEEETVSSRGVTMTASNLTPLRKRMASRRRESDYFGGSCPKATLSMAMDLKIPQIEAAKDQLVLQSRVGLATPKSRVTLLELSRAKPRRKATGAPDLFTRRERRFKALRKALSQVSLGKESKTQCATIWMELDDAWQKMMAYETFKSFEKRRGKAVSDYSMEAIDAHLDELHSWISAL
jgi:hypothetical protein